MDRPDNQAEHTQQTREAYDRLAAVWSSTTDEGPFNGLLERPALRALIPGNLPGRTVLDAGCGSGAQAQWLLDQGADVVAIDVSPRMIEEAERRCAAVPGRPRASRRSTAVHRLPAVAAGVDVPRVSPEAGHMIDGR
jgi:2-polyprenyl-3-methyl-5-hydroxy-6-metoxy-1,4-benzoquinol methylase